jgi:hypothetical protein
MNPTSTRTQYLRLLKDLDKRTLTGDDLFNEFRIKKFNIFSEVPGYIENASFEPVSDKEFFDFARGWPANKLKMKLTDTPKETVLKTIRKKLETEGGDDNFRFLWELVPEEMQQEWKEEKEEKQKDKEKQKEEARLERERIVEQWATLHPLNQEWDVPPPPAVVQPAGSHIITDWVRQYKPYLYECNGYLWRKKTTDRDDCMYEKEETGVRGQWSEKTLENETRRGVLPARTEDLSSGGQHAWDGEKQTVEKPEQSASAKAAADETETPEQRKKREKAERDAKFEIEYRKNHPLPPEPEPQSQREPLYAIRVINSGSNDAQIRKIAEAMRKLK